MPTPPEVELIRAARLRRGLSIREAARRAGISEGSWRRTESPGRKTRTPDTVARMASVVGVTADQLAGVRRPDAAETLARLGEPRTATPEEMERAVRDTEAALEEALARLRRLRGDEGNGHDKAS